MSEIHPNMSRAHCNRATPAATRRFMASKRPEWGLETLHDWSHWVRPRMDDKSLAFAH